MERICGGIGERGGRWCERCLRGAPVASRRGRSRLRSVGRRCGLRLAALVPVILARLWRVGRGEEPIPPASDLGHAANLLWMVNGVRPTADATRLIETYVVTTMDHGFNAATCATRVITSTGTDLAGAVSGGLAALAGPLHGGAPSRALAMIEESRGKSAYAVLAARMRIANVEICMIQNSTPVPP